MNIAFVNVTINSEAADSWKSWFTDVLSTKAQHERAFMNLSWTHFRRVIYFHAYSLFIGAPYKLNQTVPFSS